MVKHAMVKQLYLMKPKDINIMSKAKMLEPAADQFILGK